MIYLDYLASTPCDPDVIAEMQRCFSDLHGNPNSAHHAPGRAAALKIEAARAAVARLIDASPQEVIFTSGGTESNNLAIKGAAHFLKKHGDPRRRIITAATEHKCVLEAVHDLEQEGFEPVILPVLSNGAVSPDALAEALAVPTLLVSIMGANNETGVMNDLPTLSALARGKGALFHCDASQMIGKVPFSCADVDLASFSSHKIYGPQGVGALYVQRRPRIRLAPLFSGGGQERGLRSGTLPVALIAGFGLACALCQTHMASEAPRLAALRDALFNGLKALWPRSVMNGRGAARLPGALNICLKNGPEAQGLMVLTPELAYSSASACMSGDVAPSYVLRAMGLSEADAGRSLRLSVGRFTSSSDISRALDIFGRALQAN
ncbi:Cysteine desulfurase [Acetobacteraceae bacterium EV16G]|uniref:Cysteine desulfurase n=1 Tax=Sorlinia euscelidii TaxID=3081148 RepID=A0ABU7U4G0_9PROT